MARSGSAERRGAGRGAVVLSLFAVSYAAMLPGLFGWDWCRAAACRPPEDVLSWIGAGFPHAFAFVLIILSRSELLTAGVLAMADLLLAGLVLRWLPSRLTGLQALAVVAAWLAASVLSVLAQPYLMVWAAHR